MVVQTAFLGDVVLTLPLINALAERHGPVDVLVTPESLPLLAGQPSVRQAIPYDKRGADRGLAGFHRLLGVLRGRGYQRAVLPHRSLRSALLARSIPVADRIGFRGGLAGRVHTTALPRPVTGHETERLLALLPGATLPAAPWLTLPGAARDAADRWLLGSGVTGPFILLAPGARWATKRWAGFPLLARLLPHQAVVIGGPGDRTLATAIVDTVPTARSAAGELSLIESAALIARAALVISNDSVALHLAAALGRPVLCVAGPTGPAPGFEPPAALGAVVAHPSLPCRPCSPHGHRRCPLGHHRCMQELEVSRVLDAVTRLLYKTTRNEERGTRNA